MAPDVRFGSIFPRELFTDVFQIFRSAGDVVDIAAEDPLFHNQEKQNVLAKKTNKSKVEFLPKEANVCKATTDASCQA